MPAAAEPTSRRLNLPSFSFIWDMRISPWLWLRFPGTWRRVTLVDIYKQYGWICCPCLQGRIFFYPEESGRWFLRNVSTFLKINDITLWLKLFFVTTASRQALTHPASHKMSTLSLWVKWTKSEDYRIPEVNNWQYTFILLYHIILCLIKHRDSNVLYTGYSNILYTGNNLPYQPE
jgi:hypothetical protein